MMGEQGSLLKKMKQERMLTTNVKDSGQEVEGDRLRGC